MAQELWLAQWNVVIKMSAVTQEQSHQRQPRVAWSHVLSGLLGHGERWIYISIFFFTKERSRFSNSTHIDVFAKSWVEEEFWNRDWNIVRIPYLLVKKWKIEHPWTFCSRDTAMIRVRYMPPHFTLLFPYLLHLVFSFLWKWHHATEG